MSAYHSQVVGVQVVRNKKGWYVNVFHDNHPHTSYGPMDEEINLPEALNYVAVRLRLEQSDLLNGEHT